MAAISFNTQQDLYVGTTVVGYIGSCSVHAERIIARLDKLLIVCPDDLNPGWLNVKAEVTFYEGSVANDTP